MDERAAASLCRELDRIARAEPGAGGRALERALAICHQLHDVQSRSPRTSERLRKLLALMQDWTLLDGWRDYGLAPGVPSAAMVEMIGSIREDLCPPQPA
ncbi:MAG TPA: hypothetical protein VGE22_03145 [Solimonas sp.]